MASIVWLGSAAYAATDAEENTKTEYAACKAAIAEDKERDEPKLTADFMAKCTALKDVPLQEIKSEGEEEEAPRRKAATELPAMQGNDLTPAQDAAALERGEQIEAQAARDTKLLEWAKVQEQRWATMTPEEQREDANNLRRSIGGQAKMGRVFDLVSAEGAINQSALQALYANQAAAAEDYKKLGSVTGPLTPEQQIGQQTLASMAGEHAGRVARESGFTEEQTKQAMQNDPIFKDAFEAGMKEPSMTNNGVGAYPGQFPEAEPRRLADHSFGECEKPNGNVPSLPCGTITSGYGARNIAWSPYHYGLDTRTAEGTAIKGSALGRVAEVRPEGAGRVSVHVEHGNGFVTVHRHVAKSSALEVGATVTPETQIGAVATAGTGPHKHTEIWYQGRALNINNYNQLAYADKCTTGCAPAPAEPVQIAQETTPIRGGVQAASLRGTENGADAQTVYSGGVRQGSTALARGGNLAPEGFAPIRNTTGAGRYNTFDLGNNNVGDGGGYDTAPAFSQAPAAQQGGVNTGSTPLNQANSGLMSPAELAKILGQQAQQTAAQKNLNPEECQQILAQNMRASEILAKHPECLKPQK